MNYAKTQPELVILAVNTFVKVSSRRNAQYVYTAHDMSTGYGRPEPTDPGTRNPHNVHLARGENPLLPR